MKRTILISTAVVVSLFITGCASSQAEMDHSEKMYDKQIEATQKAKPVPIFQMVGLPGQTIELKGVQSMTVYNPADTSGKVPEYKAPLNGNVEMAKIIVPAATSLAGGWFGLVGNIVNSTKGAADKDVANNALISITPVAPWAVPPN